jgi:dTDP-4-dehydrorhamnose 3,5-epimerase
MKAGDHVQLWIPEGFAHGFLALTDLVEVQYKTSTPYTPGLDRAIRWNDKAIGISWPVGDAEPLVSGKDASAPTLEAAQVFD